MFLFWPKIWIFDLNLSFSTIFFYFDQNFDFWPQFRFLTKISIFDQNIDFWRKFGFWSKFGFLNSTHFTEETCFRSNFSLFLDFYNSIRILGYFFGLNNKTVSTFSFRSDWSNQSSNWVNIMTFPCYEITLLSHISKTKT